MAEQKKSTADTALAVAVVLPGVLALGVALGLFDAVVFWLCWDWFVPKYLALPSIPFAGAIALTLVWDSLKPFQPILKDEYKVSRWYSGFVNRLFILAIAFVLHLVI